VFQLEDQTWWLVDAVLKDFTRSGWCSVRATVQVKATDFSYSDWWQQKESPSGEGQG
jgi:hypothetical protein